MSNLDSFINQVSANLQEMQVHVDVRMEKLTELRNTQQGTKLEAVVLKFQQRFGRIVELPRERKGATFKNQQPAPRIRGVGGALRHPFNRPVRGQETQESPSARLARGV